MIFTEVSGAAGGPTLVLVHGFTQTGRNWAPVADRLVRRFRLVTVDAPGHGGSRDAPAALWAGADALVEAAGAGTWIGYSMGGRYALHAALRHPEAVTALIVVGATGGIDDPVERHARRESDAALAARLEAIGVDAFLEEWLRNPLFSRLVPTDADRRARAENTIKGLAASLREAGTGQQEPLWDRLAELSMPVLVVAGEHDAKFRSLGERLAVSIGANASLAVVPGAGHPAHLEQPEAFAQLVEAFVGAPPAGATTPGATGPSAH